MIEKLKPMRPIRNLCKEQRKENDKYIQANSHTPRMKLSEHSSPKTLKGVSDLDWGKDLARQNDVHFRTALQRQDYEQAQNILLKLQTTIEKCNYGTQTSQKKIMHRHYFALYNNLALTYEALQNEDKSEEYFYKALSSFEQLQGYMNGREETLLYTLDLIQLQLAMSGMLSRHQKNEEAVIYSERSLNKLNEGFRILQAICNEQMSHCQEVANGVDSRNGNSKKQKINFKMLLAVEAQKILKQFTDLPSPHRLVSPDQRDHFQKLSRSIFSWKQNKLSHQKIIRQLKQSTSPSENPTSPRNILGLPSKQTKSFDFSIAKINNLKHQRFDHFDNLDPFYLFSKRQINYMVFLATVCYSSIAKQTILSLDPTLAVSSPRIQDYNQLKDERFVKCKILHLKAIQIAGKHLPAESKHIVELFVIFSDTYKYLLEPINEEESVSIRRPMVQTQNVSPLRRELPENIYEGCTKMSCVNLGKKQTKPTGDKSKSKSRSKQAMGLKSKKSLHINIL